MVEALAPPVETVSVSEPSVRESFNKVTEMVATPLEFTTALSLSEPPDTSAALIPAKVYGTDVPDETFVVVSVKVAVEAGNYQDDDKAHADPPDNNSHQHRALHEHFRMRKGG